MLWNGKSVVLWPTSGHFFLPMATGGGWLQYKLFIPGSGWWFQIIFLLSSRKFWGIFLQFDVPHILNHWVGGSTTTHRNVDLPFRKRIPKQANNNADGQAANQPISPVASNDFRRRQDVNQGEDFENWRYDVALEVGWFVGVGWFGWCSQQRNGRKNAWNLQEFSWNFLKKTCNLTTSVFFLENIGGSLLITVKTSLYLALRRSQQISSCLLVRCGSLWVCQIFIHGVWTLNSMWPFFSQPRFLENQQSIWVNYDHSMHFKDAKHKSGWLFRFEQNQPLWMVFFLFFAPPTKGIRLQRQRQKPGGHGSLWSDRWEIQVWHHSRDHVPGPVGNSPQQWWWLL